MTSPFGVQRYLNGKPTGSLHGGHRSEVACRHTSPCGSGGVVKIVREWNLHGRTVGIDHGQGLESIYLHMSRLAVTEGATVKTGDVSRLRGIYGALNGAAPALVPVRQRSIRESARLGPSCTVLGHKEGSGEGTLRPEMNRIPRSHFAFCL